MPFSVDVIRMPCGRSCTVTAQACVVPGGAMVRRPYSSISESTSTWIW